MVQAVAPLVAGVLLGYILDRQGNKMMVVCPPGQTPPDGFQPSTFTPGSTPLPGVKEAYVIRTIDEILVNNLQPYGTSITYPLSKLLDSRLAARVLLVVTSNCNQALTVQVVGHTSDSPNDTVGLVNIGGTQSLPANNGKLGFGIDLATDWYPYLGLTVASGGTPPTTGQVTVRAYGQRWVNIAQS